MEQQNTAPQAEIFQNVPPHDDAAELAVLGAMFLDREAASLALEMLTGEDFYRPDHRQVFEAAEELYHSGVPIDMITVKNKLEEKQTEFPDTATFTEITERGSHRNTGEQTARNQAGHQKHNHANPQ